MYTEIKAVIIMIPANYLKWIIKIWFRVYFVPYFSCVCVRFILYFNGNKENNNE